MKTTRLRIANTACLWLLQERRKILFIPFWQTIFSSPFLEDVENHAKYLTEKTKNHELSNT